VTTQNDGARWWNAGEARFDPQTIGDITFPYAGMLHRGLDPVSVQDYLRELREAVAKEIGLLMSERSSAYQKMQQLERRLITDGEDSALDADYLWAQVAAQQQADELIARTREWCVQLGEEARERRRGMLDEAAAEAAMRGEQILAAARQQASAAANAAMENPVPATAAMAARLAYYETYAKQVQAFADALVQGLKVTPPELPDLTRVLQAAKQPRGERP
jgi:vacuolar-type H+-ATPase subunit H